MDYQKIVELKVKGNNEIKTLYFLVEYSFVDYANKNGYRRTKIYNIKNIYLYDEIGSENNYIQADKLEDALEIFEKRCLNLFSDSAQKIESFKILE